MNFESTLWRSECLHFHIFTVAVYPLVFEVTHASGKPPLAIPTPLYNPVPQSVGKNSSYTALCVLCVGIWRFWTGGGLQHTGNDLTARLLMQILFKLVNTLALGMGVDIDCVCVRLCVGWSLYGCV